MQITKYREFVDVCCTAADKSEDEIISAIQEKLKTEKIKITDDAPVRVGNPGIGVIFRFKLINNEVR